MDISLPIDAVLPQLLRALQDAGRAVLQAPPGAGKTTKVPLAVLASGQVTGKILMLEPRRLAARAAAERMAQTLGQDVGQTVGYRIKGEARVGKSTRIEVVTEGILTRMLQSDPDLPGIGMVIFDEFHERSLNADLGLALAWEVRGALREDLQIIVMSATLDAAPVAALLDGAPIITSEGRSFPVTEHFLDRPTPKTMRYEAAMSALIMHAAAQSSGGILVFLPGEGEIRRVAGQLNLPADCSVHMLYGAMPFAAQQQAIKPATSGRKVVLATAIAETSLTLADIGIVVDGGRARRARFDPNSGMSRLVTERVTRAEATQRAGRAGRVGPGQCYKLWTKGEDASMAAFAPAEIEAADLAGLALELAQWGAGPADLALLTPPPEGAFAEAQALLTNLGALSGGRLTDHGKALARLPLHPRLGHMLLKAGSSASPLAALLADRDPVQTRDADLTLRIEAITNPGKFRRERGLPLREGALKAQQAEAKRLAALAPKTAPLSMAQAAALAYPDRIGFRRKGDTARYLLSGGKGAVLDGADPLASSRLIVALDLDGDTREARIRLACAISEGALRELYGDQITWTQTCDWSKREAKVLAREREVFGALTLQDRPWPNADPAQIARAMCGGIRDLGLSLSAAAKRFQSRVLRARTAGTSLPDLSDTALLDGLETWLTPHLTKISTRDGWRNFDATPALKSILNWDETQTLDQMMPAQFTTPLGRKLPIDYDGDAPAIALKLQELFGQTKHPTVGANRTPLQVTLLSPAGKPLQVTTDIPGFWISSYTDVRKDMRGRYPRHPWPQDPTKAAPTQRAKPRGT